MWPMRRPLFGRSAAQIANDLDRKRKAQAICDALRAVAQDYHDRRLDHDAFRQRNAVLWGRAEEMNLQALVKDALRKTDDLICPQCGGPLDIDPACVIDEPFAKADGTIGRRKKIAPAALCSGCEFCVEIETK